MPLETLLLGVISGLRPATSQAAVLALLKTPDPRRTLLFFILAGFTASMLIGLVFVLALQGAQRGIGESTFAAVFDLMAGVAALAFAIGYRRGRISLPRRAPREPREAPPTGAAGRLVARLRDPSVATAAAAGVVTHIPGLIYLVALNMIAAEEPAPVTAVALVAIYNVLWFAVPVAALVLAVVRPGRAPGYIDDAMAWGRQREQGIIFFVFGLLGAYLITKGLIRLL